MSIQIIYFASLRELLGKAHEQLEYRDELTIRQVWKELNPAQTDRQNVLVAINQQYASFDSTVQDQDEVAFFPPVTGG